MLKEIRVFVEYYDTGYLGDWIMTEDVLKSYAKKLFEGDTKGVPYNLILDFECFVDAEDDEFDGVIGKDFDSFIEYMYMYSEYYVTRDLTYDTENFK